MYFYYNPTCKTRYSDLSHFLMSFSNMFDFLIAFYYGENEIYNAV